MFGSNWDLVKSQVPFAFAHCLMKYAIIGLRLFGSNRDLVNHQVPFAFQDSFYPQVAKLIIPPVYNCVTSLTCWGRVVIGSLVVYQTSGAGSNPVASTTVLTVAARSIGNDQKNCFRFAWEGPERSGLFPVSWLVG